MEGLYASILRRIEPTEEDRRRAAGLSNRLLSSLSGELLRRGIEAEVRVEGSFAKDTWLRGENDLDLFVLLPPSAPEGRLREVVEAAKALRGRKRERYAEHPYLEVEVGGYRVEVVPCFGVEDPSRMRSAVDRTPFHTRYVKERLDEALRREVRLLKRFMMGTGCYGAELRVGGFSGYLCELLVLHSRSFEGLVREASGWKPGHVIDLEGFYPDPSKVRLLFPDQPLVVVDPVDRTRNVAAAVSAQKFSTFVLACREFLRRPSERFFFPRPQRVLGREELWRLMRRRGTEFFCVTFRTPRVVEDVLYPQLRKAERALGFTLGERGFQVLGSEVWSGERLSAVLLEVFPSSLPPLEVRRGPPPSAPEESFLRKYLGKKGTWAGPYVDLEGRPVFEVERRVREAGEVLEGAVGRGEGLGKHVGEALSRGFKIHRGREVLGLCREEGFSSFLSEYLTRRLPWYR
ncbi:MAG: CCA tRNA nucleotidyltransferase [Candidatus Hadarchaeales archaeon]